MKKMQEDISDPMGGSGRKKIVIVVARDIQARSRIDLDL